VEATAYLTYAAGKTAPLALTICRHADVYAGVATALVSSAVVAVLHVAAV